MTTTAERNASLPEAVHPMAHRAIANAWGERIDQFIAAARAIRASTDTLTQHGLLIPGETSDFPDRVERAIIAEIEQADSWARTRELYIELSVASCPAHIHADGVLKRGLEQLEDSAMSNSEQARTGGIIFAY